MAGTDDLSGATWDHLPGGFRPEHRAKLLPGIQAAVAALARGQPEAVRSAVAAGLVAMESEDPAVRAQGAGAVMGAVASMLPQAGSFTCPVCGGSDYASETDVDMCANRCAALIGGEWYVRKEGEAGA